MLSRHSVPERPENLRVLTVYAGFRAPLDGQGKALSGDFQRLHHAVRRGCLQQQAAGYLGGALM